MNNRMTLKQWVEQVNKTIVIPRIQRDYVQGSVNNRKKRDEFIKVIFDVLKEGRHYNLDFIYGGTDSDNSQYFLPLDGQQRLTTLYLIYWLLPKEIHKENIIASSHSFFSYQTRRSSELFCEKLLSVSEIPNFNPDGKFEQLSEWIADLNWFGGDWKNDPTIKAMLEMIDALHNTLHSKEYFSYLGVMYDNLLDDVTLTFDILDMDKYGLTDSLYVKMNERGKQLTDFENWKARFIAFLRSEYDGIQYKKNVDDGRTDYKTIKDYFCHSIEHEWTDMLWTFALNKWDISSSENDRKKAKYPTIDSLFLNYFNFIHETLFFIQHQGSVTENFDPESFETVITTFHNVKNIEFLFESLDFFHKINDTDSFFSEIFYYEVNNGKPVPKVRSYISNYNLLKNCIEDIDFNIDQKVLLYCIIKYCIEHNCYSANDNLRNYIRVCRNLIDSTKQRDETKYNTSDMRRTDYYSYDCVINELIKHPNVYDSLASMALTSGFGGDGILESEKEKSKNLKSLDEEGRKSIYRMEDNPEFLGCLRSIWPTVNKGEISIVDIEKAIDAFLELRETKRIQLLYACGYEGFLLGNCFLGERRFFGKNESWNLIFVHKNSEIIQPIQEFLSEYQKCPNIDFIINNKCSKETKDRRGYYMLTYSDFVETHLPWKNVSTFHFAIGSGVTTVSIFGKSMGGYHADPFGYTIKKFLGNDTFCKDLNEVSYGSGPRGLHLNSKNILLSPLSNGWRISDIDKKKQSNILKIYESLNSKYPNLILREPGAVDIDKTELFLSSHNDSTNSYEDIIQIAIPFIKDIYSDISDCQ